MINPDNIGIYVNETMDSLNVIQARIQEKEEQLQILQNDIDADKLDLERMIARVTLVDKVITADYLAANGYPVKVSKDVRAEVLEQQD